MVPSCLFRPEATITKPQKRFYSNVQIVLHDFMKPLSVKHQKQVLQIYAKVCGVKLSSDCAMNEKGNCSGLCCFEPVDMNGHRVCFTLDFS